MNSYLPMFFPTTTSSFDANLTVRARAMEPDLRVLSRRRLVAFLYRCWAKNRDFSVGLRGGGVFGGVWEEGLIRFG